jgi:hypothetical protein
MRNWRKLVCSVMLTLALCAWLNELRFKRDRSPADWRAWIEWLDMYVPPSDARNIA